MDEVTLAEGTVPQMAAQPESVPVVNKRALRPQPPLRGICPVIKPPPLYAPDAVEGMTYCELTAKMFNRHELMEIYIGHFHIVADNSPAMRKHLYTRVSDWLKGEFKAAETRFFNWFQTSLPVTKQVALENQADTIVIDEITSPLGQVCLPQESRPDLASTKQ